MSRRSGWRFALLVSILSHLSLRPINAIEITFDRSTNPQIERWMSVYPQAEATIEQAASDLSELLTGSLLPVQSADGLVVGQERQTRVELDWNWNYLDPARGSVRELPGLLLAPDEVRIYIAAQIINAATQPNGGNVAGSGGFGGLRVSLAGNGSPQDLGPAMERAELESNALLRRGGEGPILNRLAYTDVFQLGPNGPGLQVDYGMSIGSLSLDGDTNNDGQYDSDAQWEQFWHLDHTSPVPAGKMDLYTTVIHELIHALGMGRSKTWQDQIQGTQWMGPAGRAAQGNSGIGLIAADGAHLASGITSPSIKDGSLQEPMMSNSLLLGVRKHLTQLDLAILQDLGWTVTIPAPSLPGDFDGDRQLTIADLNALSTALGSADVRFDLDGNQAVNQADRLYWVTQLKRTWVGDANLDLVFDTVDLLTVFQAGKFETGLVADWSEGDWNGDRTFGTSDLIVAFQDAGFERGERNAVVVPEPTGLPGGWSWIAGLLIVAKSRWKGRFGFHRRGFVKGPEKANQMSRTAFD